MDTLSVFVHNEYVDWVRIQLNKIYDGKTEGGDNKLISSPQDKNFTFEQIQTKINLQIQKREEAGRI
jgi:hypothetical protein